MKLLVLTLFISLNAFAQSYMLQDISILLPKPQVPSSETALKVSTKGLLGELVPESAYSKLPLLEPSFKLETQMERFQVVAIRIDPPEIRLVWGVFNDFASNGQRPRVLALDTALHTFYKMEKPDEFMKQLLALSQQTRVDVNATLPLSVHPTLLREGIDGAYGTELKSLILNNIGEKNLTKMTFMAMSAVHLHWDFGGFIINNGKPTALKIAKLGSTKLQRFINDDFPGTDFSGGISPAPREQKAFNGLVTSSMASANRTPEKLIEAHGSAKRFENPHSETSETMDCVSCHVAQQVRYITEVNDTTLRQSMEGRYVNEAFNLQNKSPGRTRTDNVHAFGWLSDAPSVNQRTINETANVATKLNEALRNSNTAESK